MGDVFLTAATTIALLMLATWLVSGIVRNASIVDLAWGLGFVVVAFAVFLRHSLETEFSSAESLLVPVLLTTIWGLRLSGYLAWRNIGRGEDVRYRTMRAEHGRRFFWVSLGTVFGLQGVLMWIVSLPIQATVARPSVDGLGWLAVTGAALWVIGFVFETAGDIQLARFKAASANKHEVLDRGLWRYTRHPNYFGDFCVWWGLYLIALDAGHWWTIVGPVAMTALLMKYSGAGLLEQTIVKRRPGYEDYIKKTNMFFPGLPRQ